MLLTVIIRQLLCFLFILQVTKSANWAQSSGIIEQNTVFPYIPAPGTKHWKARFGLVQITIPGIINDAGENIPGQVFILGGDTYDSEIDYKSSELSGVLDQNWGNGYKNDVWSTQGTKWRVKGDPRLRNEYHQKLPKTQSLLRWQLVTPGLLPLPGQTYDEYLVCQSFFDNVAKYTELRAENCPSNGGRG